MLQQQKPCLASKKSGPDVAIRERQRVTKARFFTCYRPKRLNFLHAQTRRKTVGTTRHPPDFGHLARRIPAVSLGGKKLRHAEQDEFSVSGFVECPSGRIGQVVVIRDHDMCVIHQHHIFDGEERKGHLSRQTARGHGLRPVLALGIGYVPQVDMANAAHEAVCIN